MEPQPKTISREGREGGEGKAGAELFFVYFASVARPTAMRICAGCASFKAWKHELTRIKRGLFQTQVSPNQIRPPRYFPSVFIGIHPWFTFFGFGPWERENAFQHRDPARQSRHQSVDWDIRNSELFPVPDFMISKLFPRRRGRDRPAHAVRDTRAGGR